LLLIAVISVASFTGSFEWKVEPITSRVQKEGTFNPDNILA